MSFNKFFQILTIILIFAFLLFIDHRKVRGYFASLLNNPVAEKGTHEVSENPIYNPLDGCLHVYLDMGSHRAMQIRKLFEPNLFPNSGILDLFDQYFGKIESRNLSEICVVGFEPNRKFAPELKETEAALNKCGWRVIIYTETGVGIEDTKKTYARTNLTNHWTEMAGKIVGDQDFGEELNKQITEKFTVNVIRIARFIIDIVATRKLPPSSLYKTPQVVMKLDVEGAELEIIPDMVMSGALRYVNNVHVDWTNTDPMADLKRISELKQAVEYIVNMAVEKKIIHTCQIVAVDDESYFDARIPLTVC